MRILVSGWHGQVARALSERSVLRDDVAAVAVGRPALDLSNQPSIGRSLFGIEPDVIINTAAFTHVDGAEDEPERARRENALGAANLAANAARLGIPIIHLSTAHVFDGQQSVPYTEDNAAKPINSYGQSKLEGEEAVAAANSAHIIIRTGWIFSPFGQNLVTALLQRARSEDVMDFVSDQYGSPTYAIHLADALLEVASNVVHNPDHRFYGVYHFAGSGEASWHDVAVSVLTASNAYGGPSAEVQPVSHANFPSRSQRPIYSCLDSAKIRRDFAIDVPKWQDGVEACVKRILA
ncbi:MAG: dTDP-4-dehydrorhamnose reductase [Pseudomonadota bacterium]